MVWPMSSPKMTRMLGLPLAAAGARGCGCACAVVTGALAASAEAASVVPASRMLRRLGGRLTGLSLFALLMANSLF
jgi:uncharacterized membrane protein